MNRPAVLMPERALPTDAVALSCIGRETFTEKFGYLYTPESLHAFLDESHSVQWYEYALSQPDVGIWVIRDGARLAAYAVAGPCTLPLEETSSHAGEVKRLYVDKAYQGQKLGKRLLHCMLAWLRGQGHSPLYLGVWEGNEGAHRFYGRYGFAQVGEYEFPVGEHRDRELIFKLTDPSDEVRLRLVGSGDEGAVRAVIADAFESAEEAYLVEGLRAEGEMLCEFVAERAGEVLGHIALSKLIISCGDGSMIAAALAPVAVSPAVQSRGIGALLCETALGWWEGQGNGIAVVLGHPEYYPRFGFSAEAARDHLICPFEGAGPAFMLRDLAQKLRHMRKGELQYAAAFNLP